MVVIIVKCYDKIIKHLREEIERYQKRYLRKTGYFNDYGAFDLISLDGGKSWYEVIQDDDGRVTISEIFDPELIKRLTETEAASQKVENHVINKDQEAQKFVTNLFKSKSISVIDNPPNKKRKK